MKLIFAAILCALTGCSSFNKEWKAAIKSAPAASGIEGAWAGEWRSAKNNHHGSLHAVVTQSSPNTYRAHYRAKYLKILRFTYVATLHGTQTNNVVTLEGNSNLGKLAGGVYTYKATATPSEFKSTYKSKHDHGYYRMSRPEIK